MPADRITATFTDSEILANDFSHANWDTATPIQITKRWSGEEADPSQHAEARLVWSDEALCVRFVCHQESPPIVSESPKLDKKLLVFGIEMSVRFFLPPT
jgi:hypothetical protein